MKNNAGSVIEIHHLKQDFAIEELDRASWALGQSVAVTNYWSGEPAPAGRHFAASLLWSDEGLYVRFEADQAEPLVVSDNPDVTRKVNGLWERDVCEIFIAPDRVAPNRYFEFEIAPTGEWIDIGIEVTPERRLSDFDYDSKMRSAARIEDGRVVMAVKIPWRAFGKTPFPDEVWLGNIFRCVGSGETRGYLSWQATATEIPNFHVPDKFGQFRFVG